ncbi:MAG: MFS transporter [Polyangiales bacterium]
MDSSTGQQLPAFQKWTLLGALYFSQGLPFGFFTQSLPVVLRKEGHSLIAIGLVSLLALPWALKFLWAPLVDRHYSKRVGKRRSWILPLQAASVAALLLLALAPDAIVLVLCIVFVVNLLSATQDIATDGLAVDLLSYRERGIGNGLQVAGYRIGMVTGGGALLIFYGELGSRATFCVMAVCIAIASIPALLFREHTPPQSDVEEPEAAAEQAPARPSIPHFLKRPEAMSLLCLIALYKFGDALATGMLRPFLADLGLRMADLGWLLGTVGFAAGLVGALAGGALVGVLGRKRSLLVFGVLQALSIAGYALVAATSPTLVQLYVACSIEHFAGGMATAALFTCMMDWSRPDAAAADYTVQASAVVIATGSAAALAGFSAQWLGYTVHFAISAALSLLAVISVAVLFPKTSPVAGTQEEQR